MHALQMWLMSFWKASRMRVATPSSMSSLVMLFMAAWPRAKTSAACMVPAHW